MTRDDRKEMLVSAMEMREKEKGNASLKGPKQSLNSNLYFGAKRILLLYLVVLIIFISSVNRLNNKPNSRQLQPATSPQCLEME